MNPLEQLEELKKETKEAIRIAETATKHPGLLGETDAYVIAEHAIRASFDLGRRDQHLKDKMAVFSGSGGKVQPSVEAALASVAPSEGKE